MHIAEPVYCVAFIRLAVPKMGLNFVLLSRILSRCKLLLLCKAFYWAKGITQALGGT